MEGENGGNERWQTGEASVQRSDRRQTRRKTTKKHLNDNSKYSSNTLEFWLYSYRPLLDTVEPHCTCMYVRTYTGLLQRWHCHCWMMMIHCTKGHLVLLHIWLANSSHAPWYRIFLYYEEADSDQWLLASMLLPVHAPRLSYIFLSLVLWGQWLLPQCWPFWRELDPPKSTV